MTKMSSLKHEFVEYIPDQVKEGTVYVSIPFATAVHKCCCGCGSEVVTPLSPTDWKIAFDGRTVSLDPSIGNWGFVCQSHYWIARNQVRWADQWSTEQIQAGRLNDRSVKQKFFDDVQKPVVAAIEEKFAQPAARQTVWSKIRSWWK